MDTETHQEPANLAGYMLIDEWLPSRAGRVFQTRSSLDWFIKRNRQELVEAGALIPREGRSGSLVEPDLFAKAVVRILRRRALGKAAA